jgi:hypothetical protein
MTGTFLILSDPMHHVTADLRAVEFAQPEFGWEETTRCRACIEGRLGLKRVSSRHVIPEHLTEAAPDAAGG